MISASHNEKAFYRTAAAGKCVSKQIITRLSYIRKDQNISMVVSIRFHKSSNLLMGCLSCISITENYFLVSHSWTLCSAYLSTTTTLWHVNWGLTVSVVSRYTESNGWGEDKEHKEKRGIITQAQNLMLPDWLSKPAHSNSAAALLVIFTMHETSWIQG